LLLFGKFGRSKPDQISPHGNEKESIILKYRHVNLALKAKEEAKKENILKTIKDIGSHEASELSNAALNFSPLKPILHPVQLMLVKVIRCLRVGRNILKGDVSGKVICPICRLFAHSTSDIYLKGTLCLLLVVNHFIAPLHYLLCSPMVPFFQALDSNFSIVFLRSLDEVL
jgi:hypothetical protein